MNEYNPIKADHNALHKPVFLDRTLELVGPAVESAGRADREAVIIDATLGLGGHSEAMLEAFPTAVVIGLDRDKQALELATARLAPFGDRFKPVHTVYDGIAEAVAGAGFSQVDAILFDLGVSSLQLDEVERGFAYSVDAPLDMRMDQSDGETAAEILQGASERELQKIFREYGDEPLAARYARAIVKKRESHPIGRSGELVQVLQEATPAALKNKRHPAKRVFQALRIAVNEELGALERAIPAALDLTRVGGRVVVLSYQSLEDRFVKRQFAKASSSMAPPGLPIEPEELRARFRLLTRGAEMPSETEIQSNPRAIPARLRAIERVEENA